MNRAIRIGLLVPAGNITFEPDFASVVPPGVTLHGHRLHHKKASEVENAEFMDEINSGLMQAAAILSEANVRIMAYGFTTATFYKGIDYARQLGNLIAEASGVKAVVPSLALLDALSYLGVRKISIVTPYPSWSNEVLRKFMEETAYEILSFAGDNRSLEEASKNYMWHQPPKEILDYVVSNCHPKAEAVLCPCPAWRTFEVVDEIEKQLRIPVVTANQATIWRVFKELHIEPASKVGTLMRS
jgi:maleate isomerase